MDSRASSSAPRLYISAPDPFDAFADQCPQRPSIGPTSKEDFSVTNPRIAILHVHRACDAEGLCLNAELLLSQLEERSINVQDMIIDSRGRQVGGCDRNCGTDFHGRDALTVVTRLQGLSNHIRWRTNYTDMMLDFFSSH